MHARNRTISWLGVLCLGLLAHSAGAQQAPPPQPPDTQAPQTAQPVQTAPAPGPQPAASEAARSEGQFQPNDIRAWSILTESAAAGKPSHDRIEALAALGTMGTDPRAAHIIADAIEGHNLDVRTAAILAAGLTHNPALLPALRRGLDDDSPQVAYAAAVTLWRMHDATGEDLLIAVALGDRKTKAGLVKGSEHKASQDLHSPKTLMMIGVNEGSGYFLGPFGVGLKAIEYANKNSGAGGRAAAIDELAKQHSRAVREVLLTDLTDPEPAVRAAAAKGLGRWDDDDTARQLLPVFGDNHLAVRLTAAAAYLRAEHHLSSPVESNEGNQWTETPSGKETLSNSSQPPHQM